MPASLAALLASITDAVTARRPPSPMTTKVVAIDGAGGAGKSTFATHLSAHLGNAEIVRTDDFASWENPVDWWPRLIEVVLEPLAANAKLLRFEASAWEVGRAPKWIEIRPTPVLILEGVTASREAFRPYLTYAIWIDAAADVRLSRGLERDGPGSREQWERWMAAEETYRIREHPDELADLVVRGDSDLWI
jgi:uridine kinase